MNKPIIEVKNISKKYWIGKQKQGEIRESLSSVFSFKSNEKDELWALKEVSFDVHEGEIFGIIGPNGSGKSTLLKILSKITLPTSGKATLRGKVSSLLEVGTGFHPELTGRENIFLNGSILGMKRFEIKAKFDEIVEFSGVETFIDTPIKHYSSGMYVRLAFSVAAYLEPEILLVDEVLSVGDFEFRKKSLRKMNDVAKNGRTVLFVSHHLAYVKKLCHKGIYLENGQIKYHGNINDTIDNYLKPLSNVKNTQTLKNDIIEISDVYFSSDKKNKTAKLHAGETIYFFIKYNCFTSLYDINIRLEIKMEGGLTLFTCNTKLTGNIIQKLENKGNIVCKIKKLPLNKGRFFIAMFFIVKDVIILDCQNILDFEVIDGLFYSTSKLPGNDKLFLVEHSWSIE